ALGDAVAAGFAGVPGSPARGRARRTCKSSGPIAIRRRDNGVSCAPSASPASGASSGNYNVAAIGPRGPSQTLAKIGFKGLTVKPGDKIAIPGFRAQVGNSVPSAWNEIAASLFLLSCPVGHLLGIHPTDILDVNIRFAKICVLTT